MFVKYEPNGTQKTKPPVKSRFSPAKYALIKSISIGMEIMRPARNQLKSIRFSLLPTFQVPSHSTLSDYIFCKAGASVAVIKY